MKTIIVDDEESSHQVLRKLLSKCHPDIEIIASGYDVAGGIQLIKKHQPDLVFLDIRMPDGDGFDLLQAFGNPEFKVIFVTGYDEYAISAIRFGALDYLLKPLTAERLNACLDRVQEKIEEELLLKKLKHAFEAFQDLRQNILPSRMLVSTINGVHFIPIADIIRLEADANFTEIFYLNAPKRLVAAVNIGAYEEQFRPYSTFLRIHRKHLVNLMLVDSYIRGDAHLVMKDGSMVDVSRNKRDELLARLREI